jgi:polar amino acid transport system substrate-binding protein
MLLLAAGAAAAQDGPALVIASEGANPPFNFTRPDGALAGFEIDLGRALCAKMAMSCRFIAADRGSLIPGLLAHRFDAVMAMVAITAERRGLVAFSDKYADLPAAFAVRKGSHLSGLDGSAPAAGRLGAQEGTVFAAYLHKHAGADAKIRLYATLGEAELDLAGGRIDAVLADKAALMAWMSGHSGACCIFAGRDLRDPAELGAGVGIALRPSDGDLRRQFNRALAALIESGAYRRIDRRYFPFSIY